MSASQKTSRPRIDVALSAAGYGLQKAMSLVVIALLTRYLDKGDLGQFFYAASIAGVIAVVCELGTITHLIRAIAAEPGQVANLTAEVLAIRLPLMLFGYVFLNISVALTAPDLLIAFIFTSAHILLNDFYFIFGAVLVGMREVPLRIITGLAGPVILTLSVLAAVNQGWGFEQILMLHLLSAMSMCVLAYLVVKRQFGIVPIRINAHGFRKIFAVSWPLSLLSLVTLAHERLDEIMIGVLLSFQDVAIYGVGFKLLETSRVVLRPLNMVLFPIFVAAAMSSEWDRYTKGLRSLLATAIGLGVGLSIFVYFGAAEIVPLIFGASFESSIEVTRILFFTTPMLFLAFVCNFLAASLHLERRAILIVLLGVFTNAVLNYLSIPRWGTIGAAWATFTSQTVIAIGLCILVVSGVAARRRVDTGTHAENGHITS